MDSSWVPVLTAAIAAVSALIGASIGAYAQLFLNERRALRERRARYVDPFLEWVHGRTALCAEAMLAARSGDVDQANAILDQAAKEHPLRDTRWRSVTSQAFRTAAFAFIQADGAARDLAQEYLRTLELDGARPLEAHPEEAARLRELRTTADDLEAAAERYVFSGPVRRLPATTRPRWRLWGRQGERRG